MSWEMDCVIGWTHVAEGAIVDAGHVPVNVVRWFLLSRAPVSGCALRPTSPPALILCGMHREIALVTQGPAAQHKPVVVKDQPPVGQQRHAHVRADGQTMRVRAPGHHALRRVSLDGADMEGKAQAGYDEVAVDLVTGCADPGAAPRVGALVDVGHARVQIDP